MFEQSADTELIRCFTIMSRTGRVITGSYSNQIQVSRLRTRSLRPPHLIEVETHRRFGLCTRFRIEGVNLPQAAF